MARDGGHKRFVAGLAVVGSAALIFTSAAFACTVFRGRMTIQGKGEGIVTVVGNNADMGYCSPYPKGKAKANLGGTIAIEVYKAGIYAEGCTQPKFQNSPLPPKSRLPQGVYDVNYTNKGFSRTNIYDKDNADGSRDWTKDCMTIEEPTRPKDYRTIGALTVDDLGRGSGRYVIPTTDFDGSPGTVSGPNDEAAICVSGRDGSFGLQAPLTIV